MARKGRLDSPEHKDLPGRRVLRASRDLRVLRVFKGSPEPRAIKAIRERRAFLVKREPRVLQGLQDLPVHRV